MELSAESKDRAVVVSVKGKVDTLTAQLMGKYLGEQADRTEKALVINLSEVYYISSAGLRAILSAAKKMKEKKLDFVLTGLEGDVKNVFKIAGFFTLFNIADTEESALAQVQ